MRGRALGPGAADTYTHNLPSPQALASLLHVKDVVTDFMVRTEEQRINAFFSAAGHGDVQKARMMLSQEMDPNTTDYDGGRPAGGRGQRCRTFEALMRRHTALRAR